ncbi:MAG: VCBS repeat-containing protein [Ignavibacteriales bacterium]|nr:VCBS repeat-containing protein [Ignavibacteriales bacterium]
MTNDQLHLTEEQIELFVLNAPEIAGEKNAIEQHLQECDGCAELFEEMKAYYTDVETHFKNDTALVVAHQSIEPSAESIGWRAKNEEWKKDSGPLGFRRVEIALPVRFARWVIHHPYVATGGFAGFLGMIAAMFMMFPKASENKITDFNPTNVEYKGEMLLFKNVRGELLDEQWVGKDFDFNQEPFKQKVSFYDFDNDGINEIFWGDNARALNNYSSMIFCKSIISKKILWSDSLRKKIEVTGQEIGGEGFGFRGVIVGDYDFDNKPEVYVACFSLSNFPSLLRKYDAQTGKLISEYLHTGHIASLGFINSGQEGRKELVIAGINNALKNSFVAVFDPRFIEGHSPWVKGYDTKNYFPPEGTEKMYIIIPKTIVGDALVPYALNEWNSCGIENYSDIEKFISITVYEPDVDNLRATFRIYFDLNFTPQRITTGDDYDKTEQLLFSQGKISRRGDSRYLNEEYIKTIQYWDGDKFVNSVTMNKRYVERMKKLLPM